MPSQAIKSSAIKSVCHNQNGLTIEFNGGNRYRYPDAKMDEYLKICATANPTQYYTTNIKGIYRSQKLAKHQA